MGKAAYLELMKGLLDREQRWTMLNSLKGEKRLATAECPCCGAVCRFVSRGLPPRPGALCRGCGSLERHRLFKLAHSAGRFSFRGKDVLHFAPEKINGQLIREDGPDRYRSADIQPGKAELVLDIERIDLPDASVDAVVCIHVLEHVDDTAAMSELFRILRPGGQAILMVPIVEGWDQTYENNSIQTDLDRWRHFGLESHVRFFGADFRQRLADAGFDVGEYTAYGADCVRYSLVRGEKVFIAIKPD